MAESGGFAATLLVWAVPTIYAIVMHEVMHGYVARGLGDETAARAGRLTLNPLRHVDLFGTLIMPALLLFAHLPVFGYAKPVPVDFRSLRPRRSGMVLVAAAGPATNLALAAAAAAALRAMKATSGQLGGLESLLAQMLLAFVLINVMLGVFNLLPLLPLDGGRVLAGLLPPRVARSYAQLERYGFLLLFLLLYTGWIGRLMNPLIYGIVRALL
jgi:Zn-dependent protease